MKHNKDLQFCKEILKSLLNQNEFEPEQKRALEGASKALRELRRRTNPARAEIYRVIRQIAEAIFNVLGNR